MAVISTAIIIALSVIAVLIIVIAALTGLRKGLILSAIKVGVTALSAILSFVACRLCMSLFTKKIGSALITKLVSLLPENLSDLADMLGSGSIALEVIAGFIAALFAPVFFVIFYFILRLIVDIVTSVVCKACGLRKKLNGFGALIGAVNGILMTLIIFVPITGFIITAGQVTGSLSELDSPEVVNEIHTDIIHPVENCFTVKAISKLGSKSVFDALTVFKVDGVKIRATEEIGTFSACISDCKPLLGKNPKEYGSKEAKALRSLNKTLEKSNLAPILTAQIVSDAGQAWKSGKSYLGAEAPDGGELFNPFMQTLFRVSSGMTAENAKEDVSTIIGLMATIVEHETLSCVNDSNALMKNLSQKNYISSMLTDLSGNERMKPLAVELMNLSVRVVAQSMNIPDTSEAVYGSLMADIAKSVGECRGISDENERLKTLSVELTKDFKRYGMTTTNAQATVISFYLLEDFGGSAELNAGKIEAFFKEANDADKIIKVSYTSATEKSGAQRLCDFLTGKSTETISYEGDGSKVEITCGNDQVVFKVTTTDEHGKTITTTETLPAKEIVNVVDNLGEPENFTTDVATLASMLIDEEKFSQIEDPAKEFQKIEEGIVGLLEFADTVNDSTKFEDMDVSLLGDSMEKLLSSELMKDSVVGMVESLLKSDAVKEAGLEDSAPIDYILDNIKGEGENKDENFSLANALETAQKTAIITSSTGDSEQDEEKRVESVQWLIENMSASSAKMLKDMITADFLTNNGLPKENAASVAGLLHEVFDGMQKSDAMSAEQYKTEADAINHLYKIAQNASTSANVLFDNGTEKGALGSADALIGQIMSSKVVSGAIENRAFANGQKKVDFMEIGTDNILRSDKTAVEKALNNYYAAHKNAEAGRKLEALAALFTIDWKA